MKKQIVIYIILAISLTANLLQSGIVNIEVNNPFQEEKGIGF